MTGRQLLAAYCHEFTVHAWELHRTTGRGGELDPALSEAALAWFRRNVPAEGRSGEGPFAPAVEVGDGVDVHTRLAAYVGRPVEADLAEMGDANSADQECSARR